MAVGEVELSPCFSGWGRADARKDPAAPGLEFIAEVVRVLLKGCGRPEVGASGLAGAKELERRNWDIKLPLPAVFSDTWGDICSTEGARVLEGLRSTLPSETS